MTDFPAIHYKIFAGRARRDSLTFLVAKAYISIVARIFFSPVLILLNLAACDLASRKRIQAHGRRRRRTEGIGEEMLMTLAITVDIRHNAACIYAASKISR